MCDVPQFDDLPPVPGMSQGCAWGVFDRDGKKDTLGTLNLLTPSVVKAAAAEIQDGVSVSLNWPIDGLKAEGIFRKGLERRVIDVNNGTPDSHWAFDDEIHFNTQCSSQWDSFCHFQHSDSGLTYNGAKPTVENLSDTSQEAADPLPTLDQWHQRGCISGRGVLLDWVAYAEAKGLEWSPFSPGRIGVSEMEAVASHQGVTFRAGDILIVRFGLTEQLDGLTGQEQGLKYMAGGGVGGVEGSEEVARWLWDQHFAAIASDNNAVEALPPMKEGQPRPMHELVLHPWCLSLFGLPLGELWDLKALAKECRKRQRYTFFLTSVPLNVPKGIGSPPNALAIF